MKLHMKRQMMPTSWPIERKGKTWVVKPISNIKKGIPILIILRDILKIAQNRKEVKRALHLKKIILNNKLVKDEKMNAVLFDVISIIPLKKYYKINFTEKGKFSLEEINEEESYFKISKVINKKVLRGKKIQLNLSDGRNILSDIKCKVNDSIIFNLKEKKIEKCLELKENSNAIILEGKHKGKKGKIVYVDLKNKKVTLNIKDDKKEITIKQLMVIK